MNPWVQSMITCLHDALDEDLYELDKGYRHNHQDPTNPYLSREGGNLGLELHGAKLQQCLCWAT